MITTSVSGNSAAGKANVQRRTLEKYNGAGTHLKLTTLHKKTLSPYAHNYWTRRARLLTAPRNAFEWVRREADRIVYLLASKLRNK